MSKKEDLTTEELEKKCADLVQQNTELQNQLSEMEGGWKRALADYQNLQKRAADERSAVVQFANQTLLLQLLPILDNLQMSAAHTNDTGLQLSVKEFERVLEEEGVEEIAIQEKKTDFDSTTMDAIETVEGPENKVVEIVSKGYKFRNKILRPARVRVGKKGNSNE